MPTPIHTLCRTRWHQGYAKTKLRTDPVYKAAEALLSGTTLPLLDIGCGIGLLAFHLRRARIEADYTGIDYDEKKIREANHMAKTGNFKNCHFATADVRQDPLPEHHGHVLILDILQFFTPEEQETLLKAAAARVAKSQGGHLILRSTLKDSSPRFRATHLGDIIAKATFWMRAAPTHYPTKESLETILKSTGLQVKTTPLWGNTPFNNYLIVARSN